MTERLIIRNFAGIEEIDIELGGITIFIGPQASGKSICAKCIYWFKSFVPELLTWARDGDDKRQGGAALLARFKDYFPGIWRSDTGFLLRYELLGYFMQLENTGGKLSLTYDPRFVAAIAAARREVLEFNQRAAGLTPKEQGWLERLWWQPPALQDLRRSFYRELGPLYNPDQLFVLAGRSFFMALRSNVLSFLAGTAPVTDAFLQDFFRQYETARHNQPAETAATQPLYRLAQQILKGQADVEGGDDYVVAATGRRVALAHASSGQQEAFPLLLLLLHLVAGDEEVARDEDGAVDEAKVVYIEEPEAHLYPDSQRAIVELMAGIFNTSGRVLQYVITTHSPYLLAAFNNLIYAHQLAHQLRDQPDRLQALYRVVPQHQQVGLANFRVYRLANGRATSIISEANGLIVAEELDEVSEKISAQFDRLLDFEFPAHEEAH